MSSLYIKLLIAAAFILSSNTYARDWTDNISTSGFLAAGMLNIDSEKNTTDVIIEGGLHLNATLPRNFELNGQVLYREFGDLSDYSNFDEFSLDYLTIDWRYNGTENSEQGISLGRFKSNGGIYSNTRDIPFTRPSILLAQSVYTEEFRSIYSHIDGVRLNSTFFTDAGDYAIEVGYGDNELDDHFVSSFLRGNYSNSINADGLYFVDLRYRNNHWLIVTTYHDVDANFSGMIPGDNFGFPGFSFDIEAEVDLENFLFGIQYFTKDYELTAELVKQEASTPQVQGFSQASSEDLTYKTKGYYFQAKYFITQAVSIMARYEDLSLDITYSPQLAAVVKQDALNDSNNYGVSITWSINETWQVSADYHINKSAGEDTNFSLFEISWRF
jgi:hypothetical protein